MTQWHILQQYSVHCNSRYTTLLAVVILPLLGLWSLKGWTDCCCVRICEGSRWRSRESYRWGKHQPYYACFFLPAHVLLVSWFYLICPNSKSVVYFRVGAAPTTTRGYYRTTFTYTTCRSKVKIKARGCSEHLYVYIRMKDARTSYVLRTAVLYVLLRSYIQGGRFVLVL